MKKTNEELIAEFENACFRITNYPSNITANKKYEKLRKEVLKRIGEAEQEREEK